MHIHAVKRSLVRFTAVASAAVVVTVLVASSALATSGRSNAEDGVHFLQASKTCTFPTTTPLIVCVMTGDVPLLEGASVAYISNSPFFAEPAAPDGSANGGRIDSDVRLSTASPHSTAKGHCTFYNFTGTGLCTYSSGTGKLAGFHAVFVIGTIDATNSIYSVIGKYWFSSGDNSN